MNPEAGIFGVAPGTNSKSNLNALVASQKNAIFTNVLLKKDRTVWWEDADGPVPPEGTNWQGNAWFPGMMDGNGRPITGAHPNSRFTAPLTQCPSFSEKYFDPKGVKISAIVFGGRRAHLSPLVCEARDWQHGVFLGATIASERTAAQVGTLGEVRRDPMAMLPFCGYNMADYFRHWLEMGTRMDRPPHIFQVNWFRRDRSGRLLWPGYGENLRILLWMVKRCRQNVAAKEIPVGHIPFKKDIDLTGLVVSDETWQELFEVKLQEWEQELKSQKDFFSIFGSRLPQELLQEHHALKERLMRPAVTADEQLRH
jgi:phosphoenolpyruvate carboxykinase (GTP)